VLTLSVALGVIGIGVILLVIDLVSRARRRAAERPIDMSRFNQPGTEDRQSFADAHEPPRKGRGKPALGAPDAEPVAPPAPRPPATPRESLPPIALFAHVAKMAEAQDALNAPADTGFDPLRYPAPMADTFPSAESSPYAPPAPLPYVEQAAAPTSYSVPEPTFSETSNLEAEASVYVAKDEAPEEAPPTFGRARPAQFAQPAAPEPSSFTPYTPAPEPAPTAYTPLPEPAPTAYTPLPAEPAWARSSLTPEPAPAAFAPPPEPAPAPAPYTPLQTEPSWARNTVSPEPTPAPAAFAPAPAPAPAAYTPLPTEPAWARSSLTPAPEPAPAAFAPPPAPEPAPVAYTPPAPMAPEPPPVVAPEPAEDAPPVLSCRGYGAGFGNKVVLADVNLELAARGITTLMGPVGTGKSTLLRSLAGIYGQSTLYKNWGQGFYRGKPLALGNRPLLVAQRIQLTQRSALDSLTFHLRDQMEGASDAERRDWAAGWLTRVGAEYVIPMLDTSFIELEPVYQRVVTILREAAAESALLMIDEPTSGLSDKDATVLLDLLLPLAERAALLVVLHNQRQARKISDSIILLAGGHVQIQTETASFFANSTNPVVMQFVSTGSCAVPSPDAPRETLADHVTPPPPLTAEALAAIKTEIRSTLAPTVGANRPVTAAAAPEPAAPQPAMVPPPVPPAPPPAAAAPPPVYTPPPAAVVPPPVQPAPPPAYTPPPAPPPVAPVTSHVINVPTPPAAPSPPQERAAVTRFPGGGSSGPRGFIWIEEGRLAATPMPGITTDVDYDLELLKGVGVTTLITLTEKDFPQDVLARHGLKNVHLPIADRKAPTPAEMDMLVVRMRELVDAGKVLAVHCLAGLGRTGTILAAYLVKEKGLSAQVALNQIRRFNRQFVQSDDQEDFLVEYEVQQEQNVLRNRASDPSKP